MKARNIPLGKWYTTQSFNTANGSLLSDEITFVNAGRDQLSQLTDTTTKPPNKSVINAHVFRKTVFREWEGMLIQESATPPLRTIRKGIAAWQGSVGSVLVNPDPPFSNQFNAALGKILDRIRSGGCGSGLDLSVDLAERQQVARMLKDTMKAVQFVKSFHPRNIANKWLEFQYGWKPLAESVYGTFDAVMHRRTSEYARVWGKVEESPRYQVKGGTGYTAYTTTVSQDSRTKIVCEYKPKNSVLQQLSGYTSLNPATILWELTPYSFVADWFINIGGYLRNTESALLYSQAFVRGWYVQGFADNQTAMMGGQTGSIAGNNYRNMMITGSQRVTYKQRFPITSQPFPNIPKFKANLGSTQMLNAAALLSQFIGKKG